ncbi:PREDICTED: ankyrin repeat and death domain-containing protein 1B-like [Amphimedon queenslandica]|uniref:Uncharacterized protein n=1 Tax=Amphimedon queenslandica TaxID=400682 RepID=A0AAN0IPZ9_AMPQE|nr:PREDICTED: ankyrin repeat and death domain-containing protein 1B-like [Amphimedon queenslandica]|eukprot:XP_011406254.1 PREDICTED: ankyrin repeat and death domain-containing protein 1B-like [Amphimedon queenslandica]
MSSDLDFEDKSCWFAFKERDHEEAVRLLPLVKEPKRIKRKYIIWDNTSLLHFSSKNGWLAVTKELVTKYHCDPHERDGTGQSCLHYAAQCNHVDVMRYLIDECHCDVMAVDWRERTPLHLAADLGHSEAIECLLSTRKCDPLAKNDEGRTPLQL